MARDIPIPPEDGREMASFSHAAMRETALALLAARRALDRSLPVELIPDPVLDILLTLFVTSEPGVPSTNDRLFQATTVGRSVVDRYLIALESFGFVVINEVTDETMLTERGAEHMRVAMLAVARSQTNWGGSITSHPAND